MRTTLFLAALVLNCALLSAQTATISGTITDPTQAVISGATVRISSANTGVIHTTTTDSNGLYNFPLLPPGQYQIQVSSPGFQTLTQEQIKLQVSEESKLNLTLQIGQASQNVVVSSESEVLATESASLGSVVDKQAIVDLPLNGRNPASLVTLANGAIAGNQTSAYPIQTGCCAFPTEGSASVNGGRQGSTWYFLDNISMMDPWHVAAFAFPNPDATQEFRVITNNFDAKYGEASSAVVSIATQAGGNSWHGTLFEFNRNSALNASNYFTHFVNPLVRNQFGGSTGGKIIRDKLFYFANFQQTTERLTQSSQTAYVPTAAEEAGNFSFLSTGSNPVQLRNANTGGIYAGNQIPATDLNPIALQIAKNFPRSTAANGFVILPPIPENDSYREFTLRGDYYVNSTNQVSLRGFVNHYGLPGYNGGGTNLLGSHNSQDTTYQNYALNWNWTISPNLVNSLNLGVGALRLDSYANQVGSDGKQVCLQCYGAQIPDFTAYPTAVQLLNVNSYFSLYGNTNIVPRHQDQISDSVNWVKGKHLIVAGVDVIRQDLTEATDFLARPLLTFNGQVSGNAMADFLLGEMSQYQQAGGEFGTVHGVLWGFYANDTIKLAPNFTLTLGLRWEPFFAPTVAAGRMSLFRPGEQSKRYPNAPVGEVFPGDRGVPAGGFSNDIPVFEPRVGIAWQPKWLPKTSIRAAFGIFSTPNAYSDYAHTWDGAPFSPEYLLTAGQQYVGPYVSLTNPYRNFTPTGNKSPFPPFSSPTYAPPSGVPIPTPVTLQDTFQSNMALGRVQTWNFSIERQIGTSWLARAAYVGSESYHLQTVVDLNPGYYSAAGARLNYTNFGAILTNTDWSTASYNALQVSVEKRLSFGLQFTSNYSWSKAIDSVSLGTTAFTGSIGDPFNLRWNRGISDLNFPQNLSNQIVYTLPGLKRYGRIVQTALGSWQVSAIWQLHSGQPFSIQGGNGNDNSGSQEFGDRADVTGQPLNVHQGPRLHWLNQYFNPNAFTANAPGTFGNSPRNLLQGPGFNNADLALIKYFPVTERLRLQIRWEAFNAFNRAQFSNPGTNPTGPGFGLINSVNSATDAPDRVMQLGAKLNW